MNYLIKNMNKDILTEVISWNYEGQYGEYNMEPYEKLIERGAAITNPEKSTNYLCYFNENELIGYTNVMQKPNGDLFLGIGLAPKHCGKGLGQAILKNSMEDAIRRYPNCKITLQVRSWNERAIKCYQKAGFKFIKKETVKDHNGIDTEFVFMEY